MVSVKQESLSKKQNFVKSFFKNLLLANFLQEVSWNIHYKGLYYGDGRRETREGIDGVDDQVSLILSKQNKKKIDSISKIAKCAAMARYLPATRTFQYQETYRR